MIYSASLIKSHVAPSYFIGIDNHEVIIEVQIYQPW